MVDREFESTSPERDDLPASTDDEATSSAPSASAGLVTRLVLTALAGLACLFLWPSGGQMAIVALIVVTVLVWFGPLPAGSFHDDDSFTSPPEPD